MCACLACAICRICRARATSPAPWKVSATQRRLAGPLAISTAGPACAGAVEGAGRVTPDGVRPLVAGPPAREVRDAAEGDPDPTVSGAVVPAAVDVVSRRAWPPLVQPATPAATSARAVAMSLRRDRFSCIRPA